MKILRPDPFSPRAVLKRPKRRFVPQTAELVRSFKLAVFMILNSRRAILLLMLRFAQSGLTTTAPSTR